VSDLNSDLVKSLRATARGGGPVRCSPLPTCGDSSQSEVGKLHSGHLGTGSEQHPEPDNDPSTPSADEEEEFAAAAEDAQDRGLCPTPRAICRHGQPGFSTLKASRPTAAGTEAAREADAFIASIIGDIQADRIERFPPLPSSTKHGGDRSALDSWESHMDMPAY